MDLRQLQTLIAVVDTRSFAASAQIVNLTPSAVSQQIQALEGELGVRLFDRSRRPPVLNAKGEEIARAARQIVQIMTEARQSISGGSTTGVLNIGAIRTVSMRLVPEGFAAISGLFPDLSLNLSVGISETLMENVVAGRLDAAVVAEHVDTPAGLIWTPVLNEPLLLIAPAHLRGRSQRQLLSQMPFIRYETKVPLARQIHVELARLGIEPHQIAVANTMPTVVGCVLAGLGVSVVPKSAIPREDIKEIWYQDFGNPTISRRVGLVRRQVSSRSAVLDEFAKALVKHAEKAGLSVDVSKEHDRRRARKILTVDPPWPAP